MTFNTTDFEILVPVYDHELSDWFYYPITNCREAAELTKHVEKPVIVFNFDPLKVAVMETLMDVCRCGKMIDAKVVTYSASKISGLNNLVKQIGAYKHFHTLPDIAEMACAVKPMELRTHY